MDPLSIATGVAGLILLAYQLGQEVDKLIQEVKGLPDELSKLATQIQHISAALSDFRDFFVKRVVAPQAAPTKDGERPRFMPNQKWLESMERLLTSLVGTIRDLERVLLKMNSKTNKFVRHWRWQSMRVEVATLQQDLDRNVQTLLVMMSTFTSMSDAYLREEVHHISTQVSSTKTTEVMVSEAPSASLFKMPSFARTNSSLAVLNSFPSFSLFRSATADTELSENSQSSMPEPPPYAQAVGFERQITWVAGYYHHGEERFCAVVGHSSSATKYFYSRDTTDLQARFTDAVAQGLRMKSINAHTAPDGTVRYCHIYSLPSNEAEQVPWYAAWDLDLGSFIEKDMGMVQAGYVCTHINTCSRKPQRTAFTGIWERVSPHTPLASKVIHSVSQKELIAMYADYCLDPATGTDNSYCNFSGTCTYDDGTGYLKFATVFTQQPKTVSSRQPQSTRYLLTRPDLEKQMAEQQKAGYQIVSINPLTLTGQELFNCTWQETTTTSEAKPYVGITKEGLGRLYEELAKDT